MLAPDGVLSQMPTVIAPQNYDGVLVLPCFLEFPKNITDVLVCVGNARSIVTTMANLLKKLSNTCNRPKLSKNLLMYRVPKASLSDACARRPRLSQERLQVALPPRGAARQDWSVPLGLWTNRKARCLGPGRGHSARSVSTFPRKQR